MENKVYRKNNGLKNLIDNSSVVKKLDACLNIAVELLLKLKNN